MSDAEFLGKDARLKRPPSELLAATAFAEELSRAGSLYGLFDFADCAHLLALAKAKALPRQTAVSLVERIMELRRAGERPATFDPVIGDVYNNRDAFLSRRIGPEYGQVHFGRSRREATNVAWLLDVRLMLADVTIAVAELVEALAARARACRLDVVPDYTYLQRAHPTTVGHYLTSMAYPFLRDLTRLEQALDMADLSPAGIGSVNGTSYHIDRELLQRLLGFSGLLTNTRDGMWAADLPATILGALAAAGVTMDRISEDLQIWATSEFGFIELDDSHCRTSVIMPQKKNPYALAGMRGFARTLPAMLVATLTTNMTPTGQPDNRIYSYGAVPEACRSFAAWGRLLAEIVTRMQIKQSDTGFFASRDFVYATEVIDLLSIETGMTNRQAHHLVGGIIEKVLAKAPAEDAVLDAFVAGLEQAGISPALTQEVRALSNPMRIVMRRTGIGSAHPDEVARMADDTESTARRCKNRIDTRLAGWTEAALERTILQHLSEAKNA